MAGAVMVTGAAGFIGSHIVDMCVGRGMRTIAVDDLSTGCRSRVHPDAVFFRMDVRAADIGDLMARERVGQVIHQAAQVSVPGSVADPVHDASVNVLGTLNLLDAAVRAGVRKIVLASSAAVYGNPARLPAREEDPVRPMAPYGVSKAACEEYVRLYGELHQLDYSILRYSNVYGPRQDSRGAGGVVATFADALAGGAVPVINGDGRQTRDFIYVEDVALANILALEAGDGRVMNVSSGRRTPVNDLYSVLDGLVGSGREPGRGDAVSGEIRHSCLDNRLIRRVLGWTPGVGLGDGLNRTLRSRIAVGSRHEMGGTS